MIYLSDSAIQYAVNICEEFEGYRVVITSPSVDTRNYVIRKVISLISFGEPETIDNHSDGIAMIRFSNDSSIMVISSETAIGNRAHLVIADINSDEKTVRTILRQFETLGTYKPRDQSSEWYFIQ